MKAATLLLAFCVAVQATTWNNVKPRVLTAPAVNVAGYRPRNARIIGGGYANIGQFPYQVGLVIDNVGFCGGSLISDTTVMTAAHCVVGASLFEVHLGATNIYDLSEPNHIAMFASTTVIHEEWNAATYENNIALIVLNQPVSGSGIESVRLPSRSLEGYDLTGLRSRVAGWGKVSDSSSTISPELMYVDLTIIDNAECAVNFGTLITSTKLCTDSNFGTEGTCNGDSGGALVLQEGDSVWTQFGIVSFGSPSGCEVGAPSVFTRVTSYLTWLENNAGVTIRP